MTHRIEWLVAFYLFALPNASAQQSNQAEVIAPQEKGTINVSEPTPGKTDNDDVRAKLERAIGDQRILPIALNQLPKNANEKRIHEALDKPLSIEFVGLPLLQCMQQLSNQANIPIVLDNAALESIGLAPDLPINAVLNEITLRNVISLIGRDLDCTYLVKHEVLLFTTTDAAEQNLTLEVYQLRGRLAEKGEALVGIVSQVVRPDTWESLGGPSTIVSLDGLIVVSTTNAIHYEVQEFLNKLDQKYNQLQETSGPLSETSR